MNPGRFSSKKWGHVLIGTVIGNTINVLYRRLPMRNIALFLTATALAGCVSPHAVLVNDEGQSVTCQATGFGILSGTMANNRYEACVSDAQMRGYKINSQSRD
jgi:hypothetical protein